MPIEFTHLSSGIIVVGVIGLVFRRKLTYQFFYLWGVFTFMLPDLDHFAIWDPAMASMIFKFTWTDLFEGLFVPREPFLLHNWFFPLAFAAITFIVYSRLHSWRRHAKYAAILAVGWMTHLALDGVILF